MVTGDDLTARRTTATWFILGLAAEILSKIAGQRTFAYIGRPCDQQRLRRPAGLVLLPEQLNGPLVAYDLDLKALLVVYHKQLLYHKPG